MKMRKETRRKITHITGKKAMKNGSFWILNSTIFRPPLPSSEALPRPSQPYSLGEKIYLKGGGGILNT